MRVIRDQTPAELDFQTALMKVIADHVGKGGLETAEALNILLTFSSDMIRVNATDESFEGALRIACDLLWDTRELPAPDSYPADKNKRN